jgi:hypothetical protein
MRKTIHVATLALLLTILGCQFKPQTLETPPTQPSDVPASPPSKTPTVEPEKEMIEPTVTFTVAQVSTDTISITPHPRPSECPHLESGLYDLAVAQNPVELAKATGLFYEDGKTRVVVELATPETDISFLAKYDAQIETQAGSLVQALVPLAELCNLSNDPQVLFVRKPNIATSP